MGIHVCAETNAIDVNEEYSHHDTSALRLRAEYTRIKKGVHCTGERSVLLTW